MTDEYCYNYQHQQYQENANLPYGYSPTGYNVGPSDMAWLTWNEQSQYDYHQVQQTSTTSTANDWTNENVYYGGYNVYAYDNSDQYHNISYDYRNTAHVQGYSQQHSPSGYTVNGWNWDYAAECSGQNRCSELGYNCWEGDSMETQTDDKANVWYYNPEKDPYIIKQRKMRLTIEE